MTGISQSEAKRLILDAIINPLHQFINGETERNQVNWLEINGLSRHFSEQKMFREEFHVAMQPFYWMLLTDTIPYDGEHNEFRGIVWNCIERYDGLGEWFSTKDIFEFVDQMARLKQEGSHLFAKLQLLIGGGYRPFITRWDRTRIEEEIEHLRAYGDRYHGEYYCILHAYMMIECADITEDQKNEYEELLYRNWDFLKHIYSVMVRRIVGSGHKNFRGVTNNVEVLTSCHPYIHLFYNALVDRQEDILGNEREKEKMVPHIMKLEDIMVNTEQENTLDPLCQILFCDEFEQVLARKRFKSYRELEDLARFWQDEASKLEGQVKELEPLRTLCESMKEAVENSIPVDDVVRTIVNFDDPKVSEQVFNKLDWDLEEQPAWAKRRREMKQLIKAKLRGPEEFQKAMLEYVKMTAEASKKAAEQKPSFTFNSPVGQVIGNVEHLTSKEENDERT